MSINLYQVHHLPGRHEKRTMFVFDVEVYIVAQYNRANVFAFKQTGFQYWTLWCEYDTIILDAGTGSWKYLYQILCVKILQYDLASKFL